MTTTPETPHTPADAAAGSPAARHETTNPFADVPIGDYVREGSGLLLLLLSLTLPWTFDLGSFITGTGFAWRTPSYGLAAGNVAVVLLVIVAILALAVTYLARAGVLPETWGPRVIWTARAGLTAPYLLLVVITAIVDAATGTVLGISPVLGIAGALLIAGPRAHEIDSERHRTIASRIALIAVIALAAVFVIVALTSLLQLQVTATTLRLDVSSVLSTGLTLLAYLALITILLLGMILRREPARLLLIAAGSVAVAYCILSLIGLPVSGVMYAPSSAYVLLFAAAGAAIALTPAATARTPRAAARDWVTTAGHALGLLVIVAGLIFVRGILLLVSAGFPAVGAAITLILLSAVVGVGAVIARRALLTRPDATRTLVLAVAGTAALLGLVQVIVAGFSSDASLDYLLLLGALGLPTTVAVALTLPAEVRGGLPVAAATPDPSTSSGNVSPSTGSGNVGPSTSSGNVSPSTGSGDAGQAHGFTAAIAADPASDAATLFKIAQEAPELRPQLAANPSTYPDLLDWLAGLGDPAITAALAARGDRA